MLEAHIRAANPKFHGLPKSSAFNANLAPSLASVLKLEDGVAPTILLTYHLGPLSAARPNFPRDVIAQFLYPQSHNAFLQMARARDLMKYEDCAIQVLLDMPSDVLAKRCLLKPITECLHHNKFRFRWSPSSDILVYTEGRQLWADNISSGKDLLLALHLKLPPDPVTEQSSPSPSCGKG